MSIEQMCSCDKIVLCNENSIITDSNGTMEFVTFRQVDQSQKRSFDDRSIFGRKLTCCTPKAFYVHNVKYLNEIS